jgi:Protein of unknown function (DUF2939)
MRTLGKLFALILFIAAGVWFYFAPHLVLRDMHAAVQAKDAAKLSGHVNFAALKDSVKTSLNAKLFSSTPDKDNPLTALGAAMAGAIINPAVDALVTPESVAKMMQGHKPKPSAPAPAPDPNAPTDPAAAKSDTEQHMGYESFDRFVVTTKRKNSTEEPLALVFQRDGWFGWKLSAVRLPW